MREIVSPSREWPAEVTCTTWVGNDVKLEVARLARLISRLVLYASIYLLLRLAISLTVLRTSSDTSRDLEILALRHEVACFCAGRSKDQSSCRPTA